MCRTSPTYMPTVRQRYRQTDSQTDGRTDGRLAIAIPRFALRASRGKNRNSYYKMTKMNDLISVLQCVFVYGRQKMWNTILPDEKNAKTRTLTLFLVDVSGPHVPTNIRPMPI